MTYIQFKFKVATLQTWLYLIVKLFLSGFQYRTSISWDTALTIFLIGVKNLIQKNICNDLYS